MSRDVDQTQFERLSLAACKKKNKRQKKNNDLWRYFFERSDSRETSLQPDTLTTLTETTHQNRKKIFSWSNSYHEGSKTLKLATETIAYSIDTLKRVYPLMLCSISEARPLDDPSGNK